MQWLTTWPKRYNFNYNSICRSQDAQTVGSWLRSQVLQWDHSSSSVSSPDLRVVGSVEHLTMWSALKTSSGLRFTIPISCWKFICSLVGATITFSLGCYPQKIVAEKRAGDHNILLQSHQETCTVSCLIVILTSDQLSLESKPKHLPGTESFTTGQRPCPTWLKLLASLHLNPTFPSLPTGLTPLKTHYVSLQLQVIDSDACLTYPSASHLPNLPVWFSAHTLQHHFYKRFKLPAQSIRSSPVWSEFLACQTCAGDRALNWIFASVSAFGSNQMLCS